MAATTVVDQLIVKLGLDPRDFTKGQKEAASSFAKTKDQIKQTTDEMSRVVEDGAKSIASSGGLIAKVFSKGGIIGVALAATGYAAKIVNGKFYDIAVSTRRLGLDARNFNLTAGGLRNIQFAAELAGGSMEDATHSAGGLAESLFNLKFNGQVSESLITLGRLGVQFTDATGKARDFKDVMLDTADALGAAQKEGRLSHAEAYQFALQAGFSGGVAQLVSDGRPGLEAELAKQQARRQVTGADTGIATHRVRAYQSLEQAALAQVGVPGMAAESPANIAASEGAEHALTASARTLGEWSDKASMALGDLADSAKELGKSFMGAVRAEGPWLRQKIYQPYLDAAADRHGIDRDVFTRIAYTESRFDPGAVARDEHGKATGVGIMQLNPKFYPNAGISPIADIEVAAEKFGRLLEGAEGSEGSRYVQALREYHAGETNYKNGTNLGPKNRAYAGQVLAGTTLAPPTPGAQGSQTSNTRGGDVTFENITINTQARDANGIANSLEEATRRKLAAAQADVGMQ